MKKNTTILMTFLTVIGAAFGAYHLVAPYSQVDNYGYVVWQSTEFTVTTNLNFISTWRTTTNNETITIPTRVGFSYECDVDWGDGNVETMSGYNDAKWTHAYVDSGDYEVTIEGTFETFYFNNAGDKLKLISISNLGFVGWASFEKAFYGCTSLNSVTGDADTSLVTSMYSMFRGCSSMTTAPATATWDTSLVTSMYTMFLDCSSMTTAPATATWDTSLVASMQAMFHSCSSMTTAPATATWDTSLMTSMSSMFYNCSSMTNAPETATWDTSLVTSMYRMFIYCSSMTTVPTFSTTNSVKLANVSKMFNGIGSGTTGTVNEFWNTTNFPNITTYTDFATGATGLDNYADIPDSWKGL